MMGARSRSPVQADSASPDALGHERTHSIHRSIFCHASDSLNNQCSLLMRPASSPQIHFPRSRRNRQSSSSRPRPVWRPAATAATSRAASSTSRPRQEAARPSDGPGRPPCTPSRTSKRSTPRRSRCSRRSVPRSRSRSQSSSGSRRRCGRRSGSGSRRRGGRGSASWSGSRRSGGGSARWRRRWRSGSSGGGRCPRRTKCRSGTRLRRRGRRRRTRGAEGRARRLAFSFEWCGGRRLNYSVTQAQDADEEGEGVFGWKEGDG
ncbi:hypothetical protein C8Q76DRAFT_437814 [Earliella scabrosa]|nr:hypothetical protein C8Q76DRAFT_437814 [Earliella scabrosa]